jgi:tetratricopeptide (TPR) repeat protein
MRHALQLFAANFLICIMVGRQAQSQTTLQDALQLENQGHYDTARNVIQQVIESGRLDHVELGRAYIMLGFAYRSQGKFLLAQSAFEQAIRILKNDPATQGDYASALENYAGLYGDFGQLKPADSMLQKALRLRRQTGSHAAAARCLLTLAEDALAGKQVHEAAEYVEQAREEMSAAPEQLNDDRMAFMETEALLQLKQGHASAAVLGYTDALQLCIRTYGENHWLAGWQRVFRGKAYFEAGDPNRALADIQAGVDILKQTVGPANPMSIASQIVYSQALERTGAHQEAARIRAAADQTRKDLYGGQCPGCTMNVAGFR